MHSFLSKHTPKAHVSRLIAELVCAIGVSDADASNEALHALCADLVYKHKIAIAPQDFITGADPWPEIKTAMNPYGSALSDKTLQNRTDAIKKVHAALSTRPLFDGGYGWLGDVQAVVAATHKAYTAKSSFKLAAQSICQLCEATSKPALKQEYYDAYAKALMILPSPKRTTTVMSAEQLLQVRAGIERLRQKAMVDFRLPDCNDYLQLAWLYGCSDKHVPQRNDCVTFRYDGADLDRRVENYITLTDSACTLTINTAKKVRLQAPVVIPLHETSPALANFLLHYRATAEQLQQSNAPYTLCSSREHKPFTTSHLTTRASAVWKKLGVDFSAHGCIAARNSSVAALNSAHGKRKLSKAEMALEETRAKQRLHSRSAAEQHYG